MTREKHPDRIENPAIDIHADVKAKSVRFNEEPDTELEFSGGAKDRANETEAEIEAGSATERENVPDEVDPDVTYRDVRVRWRAAAKIADPKRPAENREEN